ncbi:MAG TPA: NosD domain-containing protein, partial [Methanospirillum sp.]|uniref:NosD domain-containing protein n=1 Tax=Methanospirillum sp. TaxID=45200 RepID=UPI002C95214E
RWGNPLIMPKYKRLLLLFWVMIIGVTSLATAGIPPLSGNITTDTSLTVKIVDVSATIDVSQIGEIPLGQVPDERISITTSVVNTEANVLSGLRIKTFLVKEGREDTISTQLGSDFRNVELKPGEVKVFTNNYMISKTLKPGNYKVMIRIDSDEKGSNSFVQYISDHPVKIGAYAEAGGSVPIYSPSSIENPGSYLLMRDIQVGDRSAGIKIASSDVTIDGGGHTIQGISTGFNSAIYADGGNTIKNINIRNCVLDGVDFGIWFYRIESGSIVNCTFKNCKNIGIRLDQSRSISISDNSLENNVMGIGAFQSVGNKIFNNYLKNQFNAAANDDQRNFWNSEKQAGTNIAGGSIKGGNVWLDLNGTGYSASNPDQNHDGIIDSPYTINGNNIDYFPISINQVATAQPSATQTPNISQDQTELVINASDNVSISTTGIADNQTGIHEEEKINTSSQSQTKETEKKDPSSGYFAELVLSNLNATDSICKSSGLPVTCTIENVGDLGAKYFSVHYYLSDDQVISGTDKELGYHTFENLNPHDKQELADTLQIPTGTPAKMFFIGAIADPSNDIYEKDKINNTVLLNHRVQIKDC